MILVLNISDDAGENYLPFLNYLNGAFGRIAGCVIPEFWGIA